MQVYLEFEKPIAEMEGKIAELRAISKDDPEVNILNEVTRLEEKVVSQLEKTYKSLDPWQKTLVARHPARPHFVDYIDHLVEDFTPLSGDRLYSDDQAIIAGLGRWQGRRVAIMGHEKGANTQARLKHNFGMARPEGYRKAIRVMELAERFNIPVVTLVDTSGAYPGIGAEERGQSEAIARCTEKCLQIGVPFVSVIVGEGGSGGALALATANRILMLEHSIYSVASPEACASILWRSREKAKEAAEALKVTADSLNDLGVIDRILKEPVGGAHRERDLIINQVGDAVIEELDDLSQLSSDELRRDRRQKFLDMGRQGLA
ncbi:MAG: acetyl-CoA carboxylase carboxyltransferase subunit alpha [Pseudomonadota bacterium]|nr:acetyl-CoA carboxylase carboxyltransferase subunit alpha [Pseudomonadota bacterium]MEC8029088.1 acetyl-CoA carboxylase carboxyltransferase subunit alpha [Pseudomonadota bacterium]MEC8316389.1 acetyl-CoA carboxylase carboxyltransferase subunit alpha [Pseudomonadota bacterium]MEE3036280.1 acetyl-CoA carboxylase carboxyltransferase subunit alpha [Pseudomonadota bacterium]MEE3081480.1 acetyl-CoA carboxylase carboxyltransferase subunit alpha [Pseudomonadota bacterium]|tara:strand:- start:59 stop:1018 length:960 start_codon:yes stop_codon:yes gene_type:complete